MTMQTASRSTVSHFMENSVDSLKIVDEVCELIHDNTAEFLSAVCNQLTVFSDKSERVHGVIIHGRSGQPGRLHIRRVGHSHHHFHTCIYGRSRSHNHPHHACWVLHRNSDIHYCKGRIQWLYFVGLGPYGRCCKYPDSPHDLCSQYI